MAEETTLRIEGIEDVLVDIRRMQNRADNTPVIYRKIGTFMRATFSKQFTSRGVFLLGDPWKPLKPSYRRWKVAHGAGSRLLVFRGDLKASYVKKYAAYEEITPNGAEYGSKNHLAPFHEFGTHRRKTFKGGKTKPGQEIIPARPVAVANAYVKDNINKIIADHIMQTPRSRSGGKS